MAWSRLLWLMNSDDRADIAAPLAWAPVSAIRPGRDAFTSHLRCSSLMSLGQRAMGEGVRMIADSGQAKQTELLQRMQQETEEYDWASLSKLAEEYARRLHASATAPQSEVTQVLDLLRRGRQYDALMSVADAALANDPEAPGIWRRYAQALIDSGRTAAALRIFTDVFEDPTTSPDERIEARGGQGRCYKQLYLTTTAPERRADYLRRSLKELPRRVQRGSSKLLARNQRRSTAHPRAA